jgi:hypothetical protein
VTYHRPRFGDVPEDDREYLGTLVPGSAHSSHMTPEPSREEEMAQVDELADTLRKKIRPGFYKGLDHTYEQEGE